MVEDYLRCKEDHPELYSIESMCVNCCVSNSDIGDDGNLRLFFDQNERFLHKINRVWVKEKRKCLGGWPDQIQSNSPASAKESLLIQVADMLAWVARQEVGYKRASMWRLKLVMDLMTLYPRTVYHEERLRERIAKGELLKRN